MAAVRSPLPNHGAQVRAALLDPAVVLRGLGLWGDARRRGLRYVFRCPWHNEENPSCSIEVGPNEGTLRAKCFSCGAGGDVLSLIAAVHQLDKRRDYQRILDIGAELAGIHLDRGPNSEVLRPPPVASAPAPTPAPRSESPSATSSTSFASGVEQLLALSPLKGSSLAAGLDARGVLQEAIQDGWGALPVDSAPLLPKLQRPELAWLTVPGGVRLPEHRLLIPWRAPGGQVWTLQRRYAPLTGEEVPAKGGKYTLPDAAQYRPAAEYPYGADASELQDAEELWLVEGAVDVLAVRTLNAAGLLPGGQRRSLVVLGLAGVAHWSKVRTWMLQQVQGRRVFLALDADRAGQDSARSMSDDFHRAGAVRVRLQRPGSGFKDWAEVSASKLGGRRQHSASESIAAPCTSTERNHREPQPQTDSWNAHEPTR